MRKKLIITTGFKSGIGRSFIARQIIPILKYKNNKNCTKFNIVEISDLLEEEENENASDFINIKRFSSREIEIKEALNTLECGIFGEHTDINSMHILDIGISGNKEVKKLLNYIALLKLQDELDLEFYIPVQKDSQNFQLTVSILELVNNLFGIKPIIIYNRVHKDYKKEYFNFFGNENYGTENKRDKISHLIKNEIVIYEDSERIFDIISCCKKVEALDYYINFLNLEKNFHTSIKKIKEDRDREKFDRFMRDRLLGCELQGFIDKIEFILLDKKEYAEEKEQRWKKLLENYYQYI